VAERIRDEANRTGVPIVESIPLARALHKAVELEDEIPAELYEGVARLPGGTLRVRGEVRLILGGGIRIPVVGGTGRYRAATGMLYVSKGEKRALNVYRITLPGNVA
jgi:hypothetical protein